MLYSVLEQGEARAAAFPAVSTWVLRSHDVVLRVGHQSENIAGGVGDPGDVVDRSVRIRRIACSVHTVPQGNQSLFFDCSKGVVVGHESPFPVGNRTVDGIQILGPEADSFRVWFEVHPAAFEPSRFVAGQRCLLV